MIVLMLLGAICGFVLGIAIGGAWVSASMLFGFHGPTPDQMQGLAGLLAVIGFLVSVVLTIVAERN